MSRADVDAAFAEVAARREAEAARQEADRAARRALWRTHHWPERYDRCMTVGGVHLCRRCTWFYSIAFTVAALGLLLDVSPWPPAWDGLLVWLLSIPATLEFIGGELGYFRYSARRQAVVTAVLAPAVGRGINAELQQQWSWTFWGPVLVFGTTWFVFAVIGWFRRTGQYSSETSARIPG